MQNSPEILIKASLTSAQFAACLYYSMKQFRQVLEFNLQDELNQDL